MAGAIDTAASSSRIVTVAAAPVVTSPDGAPLDRATPNVSSGSVVRSPVIGTARFRRTTPGANDTVADFGV